MRIKQLLAALLFCLAAPALLAASGPANYSGHWSLDKTRSKNLPPHYQEVTQHELNITQDPKTLTVAVTVKLEQHDPDHLEFKYSLDGASTKAESMIRTPDGPMTVPATLQAKPEGDGGLLITIERELPFGEQPIKATTTEHWHLDSEGKVLTIERADDSPRGRRESTMVFTKS